MRKWILRLAVIFALLMVIGLVAAFFSLNSIVKAGVEKIGPRITQTDVWLHSVNISPFSGTGELNGLVVANPPGFQTTSVISVGTAKVAVNVKSIFSDVVVVDSIVLEAPEVTFEGNLTGSNLSKLLDNITASEKSSEATPTANDKPAEGGKKFHVKDILIRNIRVNASITGMGGNSIWRTVPEIHITEIGTDNMGVTSAQLTKRLVHEIFVATTKSLPNLGGTVGSEIKNFGKEAGSQVKKAAKGFKNFFKKK